MWTEIAWYSRCSAQRVMSTFLLEYGSQKRENIELHNMKREKSRKKDNFAYLFRKKEEEEAFAFLQESFFSLFGYFSKIGK